GSGTGTTGSTMGTSGTTGGVTGSGTTNSMMDTTGGNTAGTTNTGSNTQGMGNDMSGMSMGSGAQALMNASGDEFNRMYVSQMLTMHEAQLAELQAATKTVKDTQLKTVINTAIPKVRMHTNMLRSMNTGATPGTSTNQQ
ncbi:MAG TPA: DUF4142 domain-containing protein, partial [Segetibacter sp.]